MTPLLSHSRYTPSIVRVGVNVNMHHSIKSLSLDAVVESRLGGEKVRGNNGVAPRSAHGWPLARHTSDSERESRVPRPLLSNHPPVILILMNMRLTFPAPAPLCRSAMDPD